MRYAVVFFLYKTLGRWTIDPCIPMPLMNATDQTSTAPAPRAPGPARDMVRPPFFLEWETPRRLSLPFYYYQPEMSGPTQVVAATSAARTFVSPTHPSSAPFQRTPHHEPPLLPCLTLRLPERFTEPSSSRTETSYKPPPRNPSSSHYNSLPLQPLHQFRSKLQQLLGQPYSSTHALGFNGLSGQPPNHPPWRTCHDNRRTSGFLFCPLLLFFLLQNPQRVNLITRPRQQLRSHLPASPYIGSALIHLRNKTSAFGFGAGPCSSLCAHGTFPVYTSH